MPLSVPLSKRKQGKLETLTRARELCAYTIQICKNEKNFPKRDRWLLTQPIVTETLSIMSCIRRANSVRVETREDYVYRRGQQIEMDNYYQTVFGERWNYGKHRGKRTKAA
jgi:hypothetical protein